MKPLICFYKENQFIYCDDYIIITCAHDEDVSFFLQNINEQYFHQLKVVQINFEYSSRNQHQTQLYEGSPCSVFILKSHTVLKEQQLNQKINHHLTDAESPVFTPLIDKNEFIRTIEKIKNAISQGRLYQVNFTAPLTALTDTPSEQLFHYYSKKFNGRYKALLPLNKNLTILSFSPELFLKKERTKIITQPIKGSLSAGGNFNNDLFNNKKEEAELSMIVDLLRNDLNSLSDLHQAQVTRHRDLLELGYIQHTYSEITTYTELSLPEILHKTLPGGSISGCPKLESLKVIYETEKYQRQFYTGIIGWWQQNDFTLNLTIRSFIKNNNHLYYHAGCGIVYDSNPLLEWQEFLTKTAGLCEPSL